MTIDKSLLGAVRHYLMGEVTIARNAHAQMQHSGETINDNFVEGKTYATTIDNAKNKLLECCKAMKQNPVEFAHKKNYHLKPEDESFLSDLLRRAQDSDWRNPKQVDGIKSAIDKYAPYGGFKSDSNGTNKD
ncbi:hypothetical protein HYW20_04005 [Candidatus Woesearchaeota archaeon]|nr:hypothetical protein [Candidatus Woesearchaeota archaeon]